MFILIFILNLAFADNCTDVKSSSSVEKQQVISTDVPSHLKDAVIIVRTKDGRESQVSANQFKVVPRKQQYLVTETKEHTERVCKVSGKDNNLVSFGARRDHTGLNKSVNGSTGIVSSEKGLVIDAGYMRQNILDSNLGLGGSIDTNGTLRGTLGVTF
jgi:hypothetical protein